MNKKRVLEYIRFCVQASLLLCTMFIGFFFIYSQAFFAFNIRTLWACLVSVVLGLLSTGGLIYWINHS